MTPRRMGRPPGTDGAATRGLILAEAERQFASAGFAMTTNKTIADACGVTGATVYHYFGTKTALYEAASAHVYPPILAAFQEALEPVQGFRSRLKTILDAAMELNRQRPSLAGFVMGGPVEAHRHPELRPVVDHDFSQIEALIAKLVDDARTAGEFTTATETDVIVSMIISVMQGFAHLAYRDDSTHHHDHVVQAFQQLLDGHLLAP